MPTTTYNHTIALWRLTPDGVPAILNVPKLGAWALEDVRNPAFNFRTSEVAISIFQAQQPHSAASRFAPRPLAPFATAPRRTSNSRKNFPV